MELGLAGKTVLITGGTAGIGRSAAAKFAQEGAYVLFTGTNNARGAEVAGETGGTFIAADATSPDYVSTIVAAIKQCGRPLDVLVNNAGGPGAAENIEHTKRDGFDATISMHLWTPWALMSAVVPQMRDNGGGVIINIGSIAAQRSGTSSVAYSVAKAALLHLTRLAAAEFGQDKIRVNSISPGFVETGIHAKAYEGDAARKQKFNEGLVRMFSRRQPLAHVGQPQDIAALIAFVASDAAAFVTGADLVADGGLMWARNG